MANNKGPKVKVARAAVDPRRVAFERLFERRIEAIKEDARLLMNLSNPYNYSYEPADVDRLRAELTTLTRTAVDSFENHLPKQDLLRKKRA
ncbi:MAG: hypothetical protein RIT06_934 [Chloroflexota bacterium]|jgi:hypothetical protein